MAEDGSGALRSLLAFFSIDVDSKKLEEADKNVEGFKAKLKEFGAAFAEAFGVYELREFVEQQVRGATELKSLATRLGTTTDDLQAYELAAKDATVSVDALTTGLGFLNRNIGQARAGNADAAARFAKLGISLKDAHGAALPVSEVMDKLADKVASVEDPAKRTQIAMTLLGRHGAALIPLLAQGSKAFDDARKHLDDLGGGYSGAFIEQADAADIAQNHLDLAMVGLKTTIAGALLPALTDLVEGFTKAVVAVKRFLSTHPEVQRFLTVLAGGLVVAATVSLAGLAISLGAVALEAALAAAPFVALALAVEEIVALVTGHQSILGYLFGGSEGAAPGDNPATKKLKEAQSVLATLKGGAGSAGGALESAFRRGAGEARTMGEAVDATTSKLKDAKKAADSFFGRGGPGQTPHAALPFSSPTGKLGAGTRALTPAEAAAYGDPTLDPRRAAKTMADLGYAGPSTPGGPTPPSLAGRGGKPATYVPAQAKTPSLVGQLAAAGITLNQTNTTRIDVHTSSDQPKAIGDAVGQGVATATQRNNDRAKTALRRP